MGSLRRGCALWTVLHLGHDRGAEGRHLHASWQLSAHPAPAAGRCRRADWRGCHSHHGSDVPRQRLGPAIFGSGGRRQACPARSACRRSDSGPADRRGAGHRGGRRAHGLARADGSSRAHGGRIAFPEADHGGGRCHVSFLDGADRATRYPRADDLGDDRNLAFGHRDAANCRDAATFRFRPSRDRDRSDAYRRIGEGAGPATRGARPPVGAWSQRSGTLSGAGRTRDR